MDATTKQPIQRRSTCGVVLSRRCWYCRDTANFHRDMAASGDRSSAAVEPAAPTFIGGKHYHWQLRKCKRFFDPPRSLSLSLRRRRKCKLMAVAQHETVQVQLQGLSFRLASRIVFYIFYLSGFFICRDISSRFGSPIGLRANPSIHGVAFPILLFFFLFLFNLKA